MAATSSKPWWVSTVLGFETRVVCSEGIAWLVLGWALGERVMLGLGGFRQTGRKKLHLWPRVGEVLSCWTKVMCGGEEGLRLYHIRALGAGMMLEGHGGCKELRMQLSVVPSHPCLSFSALCRFQVNVQVVSVPHDCSRRHRQICLVLNEQQWTCVLL